MKNKIQKLKLAGKDLIFRREGGDFYIYCRRTLSFYKFNRMGFKIILLLSRKTPYQKILKELGYQYKLNRRQSVQGIKNFTDYLVAQKLISKKTLLQLSFC